MVIPQEICEKRNTVKYFVLCVPPTRTGAPPVISLDCCNWADDGRSIFTRFFDEDHMIGICLNHVKYIFNIIIISFKD
jgi:hypothetical protein